MPEVRVVISTVADGSMYDRHDFDNPEVIENRTRFLEKHSIPVDHTTRFRITYDGVDFCRYRRVTLKDAGVGIRDDGIVADALITTDPDHALMIPLADCVGAAVFDPANHVLMVAHLGRHSLEQQGGTKIIKHLQTRFNSEPSELKIWLTPAPGKAAYPIWALDNKGMKEATLEQLQAGGILAENITDNPADTATDLNYFSYSEFLKGNRDVDGDYAMVAMMIR